MDGLEDLLQDLKSDTPTAETTPVETPLETPNDEAAQPDTATVEDSTDRIQLTETVVEDIPTTPEATPTTPITQPETDFFQKEFGKSKDEFMKELSDLQQLKEKGTYKTDFAKTFDDLYSKGVPAETITQFATLDVSKLDDRQALDFKMKIDHPELTNEEREAVLNRKYPLTDDLLSDSDKVANQAMQKIDAAQARKELEKVRGEKLQPVDTTQARAQEFELQETQRKASWTPKIKEVVDSVKELKVPLSYSVHENGKAQKSSFDFSYTLNADDQKFIQDTLQGFLDNVQIHPDAEGIALAQKMAINTFKANNFDRMLNGAVAKVASRMYQQQIQRNHNVQGPQHNVASMDSGAGQPSRLEATIAGL